LLAAGLGIAPTPPVQAAGGRPASGPAAEAAAPSKAAPSALLSAADEITRQVAALRGLPQKTPFSRGVLSRAEIGLKLRERIAKDYSKDEVQAEAAALKRMGLLPLDADYEKLLFDLLTEQVAGFYDPYKKTLYIADWLPLDMQRPALAHEIEHALQDQYFDLKQFSQPFKEDGDRQLARSAVVEGDGTALMLEFAARGMNLDTSKMPEMVAHLGKQMMQMSMASTPALQQAPMVLRESLVFPYVAGLEFVSARRGNRPWALVNDLFKDPPDSTEQIIHPEKYEQHERPVAISAAPLTTLPGYTEGRRDVLGEMLFRVWFSGRVADTVAAQAAAGWGGDRLVAYSTPGEALPAVVVLSAWDSEQDATEAAEAAHKLIIGLTSPALAAAAPIPAHDHGHAPAHDHGHTKAKRPAHESGDSDGATRAADGTTTLLRSAGGRGFAVMRRARLVAIVCGVPEGKQGDTAAEVLRTWKVSWPSPTAAASPGPGLIIDQAAGSPTGKGTPASAAAH
jgi:hypothetical protein